MIRGPGGGDGRRALLGLLGLVLLTNLVLVTPSHLSHDTRTQLASRRGAKTRSVIKKV